MSDELKLGEFRDGEMNEFVLAEWKKTVERAIESFRDFQSLMYDKGNEARESMDGIDSIDWYFEEISDACETWKRWGWEVEGTIEAYSDEVIEDFVDKDF